MGQIVTKQQVSANLDEYLGGDSPNIRKKEHQEMNNLMADCINSRILLVGNCKLTPPSSNTGQYKTTITHTFNTSNYLVAVSALEYISNTYFIDRNMRTYGTDFTFMIESRHPTYFTIIGEDNKVTESNSVDNLQDLYISYIVYYMGDL